MPDDQDPMGGDPIEGDPLNGDAPGGFTPDEPGPAASPGGNATAAPRADAAALIAALAGIVGADAERLYDFGRRAGETVAVGVESVAASRGELRGVSARVADFSELVDEFAGSEHLSAEIRVALDEAEIYSIVAIAALDEVGALFSIGMSPEQMADDAFARGQIEVVSGGLRELLDLAGLMLFSDGLAGAEATLGAVRLGAIEETVAALADATGEPAGLCLEFTLALPESAAVRVLVAAPAGLLARLATLAPGIEDATAGDRPAPAEAFREEPRAAAAAPPPPRGIAGGREDLAVHPVRFPGLGPGDPQRGSAGSLDLIMDVSLRVTVELGRSTLKVEEVLALGPGSVVELNKLAGEPVDILINDRAIARGEVVVVDENFGVRVTEILSPRSRIEAAGR